MDFKPITKGEQTMRTPLKSIALTATLGIALTFTFGCPNSGGDDGGGTPATSSSSLKTAISSSFTESSSSASLSSSSAKSSSSVPSSSSAATYIVIYNANLVYNANSGSGIPAAQIKTHDEDLTLSYTTPTRTDYAFVGWNTAAGGNGTSYAAGGSYTANANVTLYAQWTANIIISNCNLNGGTVNIGTQTWMAENLNCDVSGSLCYGNDPANCNKYGKLYNWATAMALPSDCNRISCSGLINTPHRGICPAGWHIPSNEDWDKLMRFVDGTSGTDNPYRSETAGRYLKATDGWDRCGPVGSGKFYACEDTYGFAALPGGASTSSGGSFQAGGFRGYWWSATEVNASDAYDRQMEEGYDGTSWFDFTKTILFSVRCLQD